MAKIEVNKTIFFPTMTNDDLCDFYEIFGDSE